MPASKLPNFKSPPIAEVAFSIQFEELPRLRSPQVGLYWGQIREKFPRASEQPLVGPVFERFDEPSRRAQRQLVVRLREPSPLRSFLLNESGSELLQIQVNRFGFNWREMNQEKRHYPRYPSLLRRFEEELSGFEAFIAEEELGSLIFTQCELTYVNIIDSDNGSRLLSDVLTCLADQGSDDFMPPQEEARLRVSYQINVEDNEERNRAPVGRLHVTAEPRVSLSTGALVYRLELTARGLPITPDKEGVLEFLDLGREWIVRGFASITTPEMHEIWRRER